MIFEDVVELTKNAIAQTMGAEYMEKLGDLAMLDSGKLVDVGRDIENLELGSKFSANLLSMVGKIVIDSRKYEGEIPSLLIEDHEWGGFIERILIHPYEVIKDEMYELVSKKDYSEVEHTYFDPKVDVKFYQEAKEILYAKSVSDNVLKECFRGWQQMGSFLSGLETALENTITLGLEAYAHMLLSCAIAITDNANRSVHLLTNYKKINSNAADLTPESALSDKAFLTYACQEVEKARDTMKRMSTLYNDGTVAMSSSRSDQKLVLHADFVRGVKYVVKANTFHDDEIGLGNYDKIVAWQALKTQSDFNNFNITSSIKIKANDKINLTTDYDRSYAIGVLYDKMAMGVCPYRRKITSSYTASADFWTNFYHVFVNYLLDTRYPIISFFVD